MKYTKTELQYIEAYSHIPDDLNERLEFIKASKKVNLDKLDAIIKHYESLTWSTLSLSIPMIPRATPRARYNFKTRIWYVAHADENKTIMEHHVNTNQIICTNTKFTVTAYLPTPLTSMTPTEMYAAELGYIEPLIYPDHDNIMKTYSDMMQDILIMNDNIITDSTIHKKYSIKPRVELEITYLSDFDSEYNRKKITGSKGYKKIFMNDYPIEVEIEEAA